MGSCPKPGCNYTSSRVNNLSRHMRTHNGASSSSRSCPASCQLAQHLADRLGSLLGAQGLSRTAARRRAAGMRRATRGRSAGTSESTPAPNPQSATIEAAASRAFSRAPASPRQDSMAADTMVLLACRCGDFSNLARHKLTHTGDRPFRCSWAGCDYAAAQHGTLRSHSKFHPR